MNSKTIIYVDVPGKPVKVWNPVEAVHVRGDCYLVLESSPDPERVYWQFGSGDIVRCESYTFYEGETGLVARAKCECDN